MVVNMKKFILSLLVAGSLCSCADFAQLTTSSYVADAASFNGGIPQTQNVAALQKQVVVTGLQNEIVKNNADSQHAIYGVAGHRLEMERQAEYNRHRAVSDRLGEVNHTVGTVNHVVNFFRQF